MYRCLVDWALYRDINARALFFHLMLSAEYNGANRGVYVTTIRQLAEDNGLSVRNVRTALKKLVDNNDIEITVKGNKTVIKLLSWDQYQISTKDAIYLRTNTEWSKYARMIQQYEIENGIEPSQDVLRQFKILCQEKPAGVPLDKN